MRTYSKILILVCITLYMSGCASLIARPGKVILLPEERIFTVQAGQEIAVMLDDKPMKMTFPDDMKLVSPTVLVRQEAKLNDEMLKNTKASAENKKKLGIIGSIFAALAAGLGIFIQAKKWFPSKITTTIGK